MTLSLRAAMLAVAIIPALGAAPAGAAEKRFGVSTFDAIVVDADYEVVVVNKAPVQAVASGSAEALDRVSVELRGRTLVISDRRYGSNRDRGPAGAVTVRVQALGLRSATLSGAGSLSIDQLGGAKADIALRGPGQISVARVTADRLSAAQIGNGTLRLGGSAKTAATLASGAGAVDASALTVQDLSIDAEGAGQHQLRAMRSARIVARGTGRIDVAGTKNCTITNAGTGRVTCSLAPAAR